MKICINTNTHTEFKKGLSFNDLISLLNDSFRYVILEYNEFTRSIIPFVSGIGNETLCILLGTFSNNDEFP